MTLTKVSDFCKSEACPPSSELLEFEKGTLSPNRCRSIDMHLIDCDFCAAEVEFYCHFPQTEEFADVLDAGEVPAALYDLAEALLRNRHADASSLNSLLREKEGLVLDAVN